MKQSHLQHLDDIKAHHAKVPLWWEGCLIRIAEGDTLWDIAAEKLWAGGALRFWIRCDDEREIQYQDALNDQTDAWKDRLKAKAGRGAFATIQDAKTSSGEWLDVHLWPPGLLAACDSVEFGPDGAPYKIRMDSGKHADRLARYVGLEKAGDVNVSVYSLVGVLSEMPRAEARELPGAPKQIEAEDAEIVPAPVAEVAEVAQERWI